MDYTLFWAQLFSIYLVVIGLSLFGRKKDMLKMMAEFRHSTALLYVASVITLFLGGTMVLTHNVWDQGGLAVLVSIIGWMILIKGILYALAPQTLIKIGKPMVKGSGTTMWATITLIVGLILGYFAFIIG